MQMSPSTTRFDDSFSIIFYGYTCVKFGQNLFIRLFNHRHHRYFKGNLFCDDTRSINSISTVFWFFYSQTLNPNHFRCILLFIANFLSYFLILVLSRSTLNRRKINEYCVKPGFQKLVSVVCISKITSTVLIQVQCIASRANEKSSW